MRIAITGASGFVGGVSCRALRAGGDEPVPIVRRASGLEGERIVAAFARDALAPDQHRRLRVRLKFSRRRWLAPE